MYEVMRVVKVCDLFGSILVMIFLVVVVIMVGIMGRSRVVVMVCSFGLWWCMMMKGMVIYVVSEIKVLIY